LQDARRIERRPVVVVGSPARDAVDAERERVEDGKGRGVAVGVKRRRVEEGVALGVHRPNRREDDVGDPIREVIRVGRGDPRRRVVASRGRGRVAPIAERLRGDLLRA